MKPFVIFTSLFIAIAALVLLIFFIVTLRQDAQPSDRQVSCEMTHFGSNDPKIIEETKRCLAKFSQQSFCEQMPDATYLKRVHKEDCQQNCQHKQLVCSHDCCPVPGQVLKCQIKK